MSTNFIDCLVICTKQYPHFLFSDIRQRVPPKLDVVAVSYHSAFSVSLLILDVVVLVVFSDFARIDEGLTSCFECWNVGGRFLVPDGNLVYMQHAATQVLVPILMYSVEIYDV